MAFAINSRSSVNSGTAGAANYATAAFTPAANSRLFVFAVAEQVFGPATRSWTISDTLGSTWTKLNESVLSNWSTNLNFDLNVVAWYTDIGASPSSMTVTVDASAANEYYGVIAFDVTGHNPGTPFAQSSVANGASVNPASDSASGTLTLGGAPTNGNLVVAMFGSGADSGGGFATPTGYTALVSQSQAYAQAAVFYHTSTTTAAVTCSDLGQQVGNWGGIIFEMALASVKGLVRPRRRHYFWKRSF
mgnify:CR=1 FL=1